MEVRPLEGLTGVRLSARGNIAVAGKPPGRSRRPGWPNQGSQTGQGLILGIGVAHVVCPFQFDTDGKVIALFRALKTGASGMPGAVQAADKLNHRAVSADKPMGGNLQICNGLEIGMGVRIQPVTEEFLDMATAELARRQADVVYHQ